MTGWAIKKGSGTLMVETFSEVSPEQAWEHWYRSSYFGAFIHAMAKKRGYHAVRVEVKEIEDGS